MLSPSRKYDMGSRHSISNTLIHTCLPRVQCISWLHNIHILPNRNSVQIIFTTFCFNLNDIFLLSVCWKFYNHIKFMSRTRYEIMTPGLRQGLRAKSPGFKDVMLTPVWLYSMHEWPSVTRYYHSFHNRSVFRNHIEIISIYLRFYAVLNTEVIRKWTNALSAILVGDVNTSKKYISY